MEELLEYDKLIYSIINKYPKRFDREDLYQVAMLGLMDAYSHYQESYDTKFSSFAYYYIIGEVNKFIRESNSIKISKSLIDLKKKAIQVKEVMAQKLGRDPTMEELSIYLDVDYEELSNAFVATDEVCSLDSIYDCGEYDNTSCDVLDLKNEIDQLSPVEKQLIEARYYGDYTQKEVSSILGISQVQVSRKEAKILQKLKSHLAA